MNKKRNDYQIIINKLDKIIKLLTLILIQNLKTDKEKIIILSEMGMSPAEIKRITGIRDQYIYDVRSQEKLSD